MTEADAIQIQEVINDAIMVTQTKRIAEIAVVMVAADGEVFTSAVQRHSYSLGPAVLAYGLKAMGFSQKGFRPVTEAKFHEI